MKTVLEVASLAQQGNLMLFGVGKMNCSCALLFNTFVVARACVLHEGRFFCLDKGPKGLHYSRRLAHRYDFNISSGGSKEVGLIKCCIVLAPELD